MFLFTGDESGRGHILSPEGQETLLLSKSLLDALVRVITVGSVTVEVLLLLQKFKQTFLELLTTATGVEKEDAELSLAHRIEEIEEFHAVKENLLTFIGMCDVIQPGKM